MTEPVLQPEAAAVRKTSPVRYAIGMFGTSIPINMFRTYAAIFYVDRLGLSTEAFALILFIYTFIDAIDNPIYGYLSDNTRSRFGRRKPWLVIGAPLLGLSFIAFFNPPALAAGTPLMLYALMTYIITGTLDSLINANYGALFPELFKEDAVRAKTNAMRQVFQLVAMIISISLTPLVADALGYPMTAMLYSVLGIGVILFMTFGCHENLAIQDTDKPHILSSIKAILTNRKFWIFGSTGAFYSAAMSLVLSSIPFYTKYALGEEGGMAVTLLSAAVIVIAIVSVIGWVWFVKRSTVIRTFSLALLTMAIGFIPLFFARSVPTAIAAGAFLGFGLAGVMTTMDLIGAKIMDEDTRRHNVNREGIYMSAMGFLNRLNGLFTSFAFFLVYRLYGFESGQQVGANPGGAARFLLVLFPAVLMVISFLISRFIRFSEVSMANKHVIVLSVDAMSEADWDTIGKLDTFRHIIENGASSKELMSVFPTHTYTVHTTMVTGVYPGKHGILHNHPFQPFVPDSEQTWYWYRNEVKADTVYDAAKRHGMRVASLLWPVTGKSGIRYNIPEIAALPGENQILKIFKSSSKMYLAEMELKLGKQRKGFDQPHLDDFATLMAAYTIKHKKPDLMLVHLTEVDNRKHLFRVDSDEVKSAFRRMDTRIRHIIDSTKEVGIFEDTTFIILGDHGQFNVDFNVHLNNLLRDAGLIEVRQGRRAYRAYLQTTGGNAFLHFKTDSKADREKALDVLHEAMRNEACGIEAIYSAKDLEAVHFSADIEYVVEAKPGFHFHDGLTEETIEDYGALNKKYATHGFDPRKDGYKCIFLAFGKDIEKGVSVGPMEMVDVAPTIAELLGFHFPCDGKSIAKQIKKPYDGKS